MNIQVKRKTYLDLSEVSVTNSGTTIKEDINDGPERENFVDDLFCAIDRMYGSDNERFSGK